MREKPDNTRCPACGAALPSFGFTREMLHALDEAYRVVICAQNGGPVERTDDQLRGINDGLLAVGHRIAALLPPERASG